MFKGNIFALIGYLYCLFKTGSSIDICTGSHRQYCEQNKWLVNFDNEPWYDSLQLYIPSMPPGIRDRWCSTFFAKSWTGCLEQVAASCTDAVKEAQVQGRYESQTYFCHTTNTLDYEHYWSCLERSDTQNKIAVCSSTFSTATSNLDTNIPSDITEYLSLYSAQVNCFQSAARTECGEESAMFVANSFHQYWHLVLTASYNYTMTAYTPPVGSCDVSAAETCMDNERVYWNSNNGNPDCVSVDQRMAKAHGCVFEKLYNCDSLVKQSFYNTDLYVLMTLIMNHTLTRCKDTPQAADDAVACNTHTDINQDKRSSVYVMTANDSPICDTEIDDSKWYRFTSYTGNEVPETSVQPNYCGTKYPIWMNDQHPRTAEFESDFQNAKTVTMCTATSSDACFIKTSIKVRNCRENGQTKYFSYNLKSLPSCTMSYCAGSIQPCQTGYEWNYQINECRHPNCTLSEDWNDSINKCLVSGSSPTMNGAPVIINPVVVNGKVVFKCQINYVQPSQDDGARFTVSWLINSQNANIPTETVTSQSTLVVLDEQYLFGHMGKGLSCSVQSYWNGWNHFLSTALESTQYLMTVNAPTSPVVVNEKTVDPVTITLTSSVPVACTTSTCVTLTVNNSPGILGNCSYDIGPEQQFKLHIRAERTDTLRSSSFSTIYQFNPLATASNSLWNGYQLPDINVQIVDSQELGLCSVIGNSFIKTFDNTNYPAFQSGQYILWKSSVRNFEVQVRSHPCSQVSCPCAVYVYEEDIVLGIDFCDQTKGYPTMFVRYHDTYQNGDHGSINNIDATGNYFQINLASGAKVKARLVQVNGIQALNLDLIAPSEDFGHTDGLCASWDDNSGNDLNELSYQNFAESYRIQSSYIDTAPSCTAVPANLPYCKCVSSSTQCFPQTDGQVILQNLEIFCNRKKRSLEHNIEKRAAASYTYTYNTINTNLIVTFPWPTASGVTELDAENACQSALQGSTSYQNCQNIVNISSIVDTCKQQIQVSDNINVTTTAVSAMEQYCIFKLQTSIVVGSVNQVSATQQLNNVVSNVCPAQCSGHGTCSNSVCTCDSGYTGSDCGLQAGLPPRIWSLEETLLDIQTKQWASIRAFGYGFWNSSNLACKMKNVTLSSDGQHITEQSTLFTSATLNSAYEVFCEIPTHPVISGSGSWRSTEHGFKLSITTDGINYSDEVIIVLYDSACRKCTTNGVCTTKTGTCQYDGLCMSGVSCQDPCVDPVDVGNPKRSTAYSINGISNPTIICDQVGIGNGKWYRFNQYTGSEMPESCVNPYHCATHSPIWLNGTHPTAQSPGPVSIQVCANKPSTSDCCDWSDTIQVKYCALTSSQSFHVYELKAVPECEMAYCSGSIAPCTDGYQWNYNTQSCQDIDECLSNPCNNNGNCTNLVNSFTCTCSPGFTGQYCQTNIDDCGATHNCTNGGSCIDGINSYSCSCMVGYTGSLCDIDINECDSVPCLNGATCVDIINSFSCQCAATFTGSMCQSGVWGPWSDLSTCSKTCGYGYQQSSRQCTSTASCSGDSVQYKLCQLAKCPNINTDDDQEGAILTILFTNLLNAVVNEATLVSTVVTGINEYCRTHTYDFCSSFELQSKMQASKPSSMITTDHITVEYIKSGDDAMIQIIVTVQVQYIQDFCVIPTSMDNMPDRVYLKDTIVASSLSMYIAQIEQNTQIKIKSVQTTSSALSQTTSSPSVAESTKVPIIVAGAIFGTVALIISLCIIRGIYKSKSAKSGTKRTISRISVNPIIGPDTRPTTPASIFSASNIHVTQNDRPFSGTSSRSGWSSRPMSGVSLRSGRPLSGVSARSVPEGRPHSGTSSKSGVSIIPPTYAANITSMMNPKVTTIYEGLLNDKSYTDQRRLPGQPSKSLSFNIRDIKPKQPGYTTFKPFLPKQPPVERDGMTTAVSDY